jgi:hypothetical protein
MIIHKHCIRILMLFYVFEQISSSNYHAMKKEAVQIISNNRS